MKRTHLSTWRMIFQYFNCVLHNYIKYIHNCNHWLSYFKLHDTILMASGNYCGRLDLVIPLAHRAIGFKLECTPCTYKMFLPGQNITISH